jgi:hypothetical protein
MHWKTAAWLVLAMGTAAGAQAQVYKSIGPDGKVVYTDKPPAGTVVKPPPPRLPARSLEAAAKARAANPQGAAAAPVEPPPVAARQEPERAARLDPVLDRALLRVMGYEDLLQRAEKVCLATIPTSAKKYGAAANSWKQRNAKILEQYRKVMAEGVTDVQRKSLEDRVQSTNEANMAIVVGGELAARIRWCDQSYGEIAGGKMDLHDEPAVSGPLMDYQPKPG